jgi:hypothetical protein
MSGPNEYPMRSRPATKSRKEITKATMFILEL